ncbi:MAG: response regulator transcription factor [Halobacteriovoraceae bacterium]|nr:response regulator transcription factor [Halobacteriovoraceae bacterium]
MRSTILVLEDNKNTANYLKTLLLNYFSSSEVIVIDNLQEGKRWIKSHSPSLAFIDIGLPDGSGLDFLKELKMYNASIKAIIVTAFADDQNLFQALSLGADGYILKDLEKESFLYMLSKIEQNEPPLSPSIAKRMMQYFQKKSSLKTDLSPRESETLCLIAKGYTVPEAAKEMGLSPQTVAGYVKKIYEKLHVSNRAEVTREAIRLGFI